MGDDFTKQRLGRGLAALLGDAAESSAGSERARGSERVPVELLRPNPRNPRKHFSEAELADLTNSVKQRGIVQPIVVRQLHSTPGTYEIVAGERRWRAAQAAGLHEVPVAVVDVDDQTSLEFAIIENVQRADLNAIEEAGGYARLMEDFGYSQSDLATMLGRSRSHVANTLRLLNLPASIQAMVIEGRISAGHARALLSVDDPDSVADEVLERGLTVRDVEKIASSAQADTRERSGRAPRRSVSKDPDTRALEKALEDVLGLGVVIDHRGKGGELRIRYETLEQLDHLCRGLRHSTAH